MIVPALEESRHIPSREYLNSTIYLAEPYRRVEDKSRLFYVDLDPFSSLKKKMQRNGSLTDGK